MTPASHWLHPLRAASHDATACTPGALTLGTPGDVLYPETGNGGYLSVHTDVNLVYNAPTNRFLAGNNVVLTDEATQCLTSFSLDFERTSADTVAGPDLTVGSVTVDGAPAGFTFVQPTYPGDPLGQDDLNPAAHEMSQTDPVGGPHHNALPPACAPELLSPNAAPNAPDGQQCPADKLVVTPSVPIDDGVTFTVTVNFTGRPGIHHDGDGSTEGWFRFNNGGFVTTEPVGTEDWMPLNDFPTAKPTYDFYDTVNAGLKAICNGMLVSTTFNPPTSLFPKGSTTWHWRSTAPVASYLVENSVGNYVFSQHVGAQGVTYYQAQSSSISAAQQKSNLAVMNRLSSIIAFESQFSGPYPFTSAGIVVGGPSVSFEEEMQTMMAFAGSRVGTSILYHETMHQWWGDNVTEAGYNMIFYKEAFAVMAQDMETALQAETAAGGPKSPAGPAAFEASLVSQFDASYSNINTSWTTAPSNPSPDNLYDMSSTYVRPSDAMIALRLILGPANFDGALQQIQRTYGGGTIDETQLEAAFHQWMPDTSSACSQKLDDFFTEWFDTAYPAGGGANAPQITGPGLDGAGFYDSTGGCS
jgi:hypothetical protein